ncbi:MAG: hypothetical protein OQK99_11220 [Gammaproteobacteria bacterium]|jgi:hypothetical protein|nr:hypothetical protein [Gammaproteobacteria bacterium]
MKIKHVLTAALFGLGLAASAGADTLLIDIISQDNANEVSRPAGGLDMSQVEANFGPPTIKHAAVGDPPISRWEYADFVVYFEGQTVLHSVRKHQP